MKKCLLSLAILGAGVAFKMMLEQIELDVLHRLLDRFNRK